MDLRIGVCSCLIFFIFDNLIHFSRFFFCFVFFKTKLIGLESCTEIKLIVVFFCDESMTFLS